MGELTVSRGGRRPLEHHWLVPAELRDPADQPSARRSTRDWVADSLCFAAGMGWALLAGIDLLRPHPGFLPQWAGTPAWLAWLDLVVGVGLALSLWWRRRFPVQLAVLGMVVGVFSVAAAIATMIIMFTVAVHRRFEVITLVAVGSIGANAAFCYLRPEAGTSVVESVAWSTLFLAIIMLWGMVVRSRRQLVLSLRERAERAESEQQLRVTQARAMERTRIAREMHDVLAHRISLLSLHAGALEIHPEAASAEVAGAAGVIRASAHQALQDLREVIGVLRDPAGHDAPERPQPTLRELPALADESRAAGVKVRLDLSVDGSAPLPAGTGRAAYRIVQEGLTNARKHAPGTAVRVRVAGAAGTGLTIDIRNPAPVGSRPLPTIPGTGNGLVGLAERATLAGGRLTSGRGADGEFTVSAWLPWPQSAGTP
ncbi:sensor histidine kinase [Actinoplanes sp. ATCC 53533]|uniref:sensor histidine kinase n=1 Tax=Actinoplanes sp. ATCC 53533 TaxID=1288362 RepID=UPI000F7B9423|nr:histidine kinase [Actinoplanes sp. ATCC 53533]RSM73127.1 sensor histidine kinase [Actinoplanes sp. ATCC 53533]